MGAHAFWVTLVPCSQHVVERFGVLGHEDLQ
jgi:hypothetical protein